VSRLQYTTESRIIRVMCSGRVDLSFVLRAFSNGNDGVFIGGCRFNDCNYSTNGNYHALNMVLLCKKLMESIGLNPERLRMETMSAGEGNLFAEVMNDFGKTIKGLGPLGKSEGIDVLSLKSKLEAVTNLVPYIRLVERERMRINIQSEEVYHEFFASDEFKRLFDETIGEQLGVSQIISLLRLRPHTTGEISKILDLTPSEVSRYLNNSSRQGLVRYEESQKCFALA